jgi:hypothetical protein
MDRRRTVGCGTASRRWNRPPAGQDLGILGLGRIGRRWQRSGFCLELIASDPFMDQRSGDPLRRDAVSLDELLARADILTCTPAKCPRLATCWRLNSCRAKSTALLVNTARGMIVDAVARAVDVMRAGRPGGAPWTQDGNRRRCPAIHPTRMENVSVDPLASFCAGGFCPALQMSAEIAANCCKTAGCRPSSTRKREIGRSKRFGKAQLKVSEGIWRSAPKTRNCL